VIQAKTGCRTRAGRPRWELLGARHQDHLGVPRPRASGSFASSFLRGLRNISGTFGSREEEVSTCRRGDATSPTRDGAAGQSGGLAVGQWCRGSQLPPAVTPEPSSQGTACPKRLPSLLPAQGQLALAGAAAPLHPCYLLRSREHDGAGWGAADRLLRLIRSAANTLEPSRGSRQHCSNSRREVGSVARTTRRNRAGIRGTVAKPLCALASSIRSSTDLTPGFHLPPSASRLRFVGYFPNTGMRGGFAGAGGVGTAPRSRPSPATRRTPGGGDTSAAL